MEIKLMCQPSGVKVVDLPWILGYLISTFSPYLMVELVVSVPAKNRLNTVDTRLS